MNSYQLILQNVLAIRIVYKVDYFDENYKYHKWVKQGLQT